MDRETEYRLRAGDRRAIRSQSGPAEERCRQRLIDDLGLDDEAVQIIMSLRDQVTTLQRRLRELESTVEIYQAGYSIRLMLYREVVHEVDWEDI